MIEAETSWAERNIGGANTEIPAGRLGLALINWTANALARAPMFTARAEGTIISKLKRSRVARPKRCRPEPRIDSQG